MHKRVVLAVALALFFSLFVLTPASAMSIRSSKSTLQGTITNAQTSQPIPEATVILSNLNRESLREVSTDAEGKYKIKSKYSGQYLVIAQAPGFQDASSPVTLKKNKTTQADLRLTPLAPGTEIRIESLSPADNSTFLAGANIQIKPTIQNPANLPLEYQFSIGGSIVQPWATSDTYAWRTSSSDTGLISLLCEARSNSGQKTSREVSVRIINPSVEEVLRKVAENYAKIQDFKADMVLSSTLDGQPFGETEYCRYYFKAPNKEKTETFSDQSRSVKTDIIIIAGSTMHFVNPVDKIVQQADLLAQANLTSTQFNQMDFYYSQQNFLRNHSVSKNATKTDSDNFIIALDAIPKVENNLYTKLELQIDYNKGLLTKLIHYKNEELPQSMEVIESIQMPNSAWVVSKFKKIPNLTVGNLIPVLTYENIQINTGLNNLDFDPDRQ